MWCCVGGWDTFGDVLLMVDGHLQVRGQNSTTIWRLTMTLLATLRRLARIAIQMMATNGSGPSPCTLIQINVLSSSRPRSVGRQSGLVSTTTAMVVMALC